MLLVGFVLQGTSMYPVRVIYWWAAILCWRFVSIDWHGGS